MNLDNDDKELVTIVSGSTSQTTTLEESWKFVASSDFMTFYVLGSEPRYINAARSRDTGRVTTRPGFEFGSYDSSEYTNTINSKVLIHRLTFDSVTGWERITYLNAAAQSNLIPQLAMHYHLGFARTDSTSQNRFPNRQGSLPDSRRNLHLASNGDLYYAYANRSTFGVAKATDINSATSVISANRDNDGFNLAGFDFWIDEAADHIFLAYTNIKSNPNESRFKIIRKDL